MYHFTRQPRPVRRARTAACGSETAEDVQPAAPQQVQVQPQTNPHSHTSADSAERQGAQKDAHAEWMYSPQGKPVRLP
jgi:hypothetical protein